MKKLALFALVSFLAGISLNARADLLFSDDFNYPDGLIETDGLWYCYSPAPPASPYGDAFVVSNLLILNVTNRDSVAAPINGQGVWNPNYLGTNYASFYINVKRLPPLPSGGGYFCTLLDTNRNPPNTVAHLIVNTEGTVVPGSYRVGVANFAGSVTSPGATNFPMDLATNITYQIVFFWDSSSVDNGAQLWVNPSSQNDLSVYPIDTTGNVYLQNMPVAAIGFSPFPQDLCQIGHPMIGTTFSDVMTNVPALPVIGIQPQGFTNYSGQDGALYTAASGMDVTYQWYANNVQLVDNGTTVVGSTSQALLLSNLQATATYYVVATDAAGSTTSSNAIVAVNTTPTAPFFTYVFPSQTNVNGQPITLRVSANGTGPISYQWYFSSDGVSFHSLFGATAKSYSITAGPATSGYFYVHASNSAGSTNSMTNLVLSVPPTLVNIASLHAFATNDDNLDDVGQGVYEVQGVVTTIGNILYGPGSAHPSYNLFFIQDGTGGIAVFNQAGATNNPPAGTLVQVLAPLESYYGELELSVSGGGSFTNISYNNPLPAPQLLDMPQFVTNTYGPYGAAIQCSLVTLTNVYLSQYSTEYVPPTGNFPTNAGAVGSPVVALYAWQSKTPNPGQTNIEVYVYTLTNALNQINTNYWGQPIPSFCSQLTGILGLYSPTSPQLYPTRYQDLVTTPPASFRVGITKTNGMPTLTWPAVAGSTYSVYSATSLLGPWTQTFGSSYYPSTGTYTDTNSAPVNFYRVSSP